MKHILQRQCHAALNDVPVNWYIHVPQCLHGPLSLTQLTLIPALISNYIHYKVCDEITYPYPSFNGGAVEIWEWLKQFPPTLPRRVTLFGGKWMDFTDRYVLEIISIQISVRCCVCETSSCASNLLFERANLLLQRPPSALCRRITWLPRINPTRSCFNIWGQGSISVKNTHRNDILFDKCRKILKRDTNKQNESWTFY